jgi:hypothetical protein
LKVAVGRGNNLRDSNPGVHAWGQDHRRVTVTDAPSSTPSATVGTPAVKPTVVSGTSALADAFRSRFVTDDDYRRFHARAPR